MYLVHKPDTHYALEVPLAPESVRARLEMESDRVRSIVWSPGFGASKGVVAELRGDGEIRMRIRHAYSNGLTRFARVRLVAAGAPGNASEGTRVELVCQSIRWVEWIMRGVWLVLLLPVAAVWNEPAALRAGAAVAVPTVAVLAVIEWVARRLGDRDEEELCRRLERWLGVAPTRR